MSLGKGEGGGNPREGLSELPRALLRGTVGERESEGGTEDVE